MQRVSCWSGEFGTKRLEKRADSICAGGYAALNYRGTAAPAPGERDIQITRKCAHILRLRRCCVLVSGSVTPGKDGTNTAAAF